MLQEYSARDWFRIRRGQELWQVHPADLLRWECCQEAARRIRERYAPKG